MRDNESWRLKPHWPELFSKAEHNWKYLDRVCRAFDLRKHLKFNHKVTEAIWNEEQGKWKLKVAKIYVDESIDEFGDECVSLPIAVRPSLSYKAIPYYLSHKTMVL